MTQLFALHSAFGLATAAAAIDDGLLGGDGDRLLVPVVSARVPETVTGIGDDPTLASLRARFDRVEDLNALLGARHPSAWEPDDDDLPMLERLLTRAWGLDPGRLELFVQSPQVAPARTLMSLFPRARITIVGDGLMTYSPMRVVLPHTVSARITRVVHADIVPGVRPLVGGPAAASVPIPGASFHRVLQETDPGEPLRDAADREIAGGPPTVLVLGQYLAALGLMSSSEETALQRDLVDRAAEWSPERIVFKPHPAAPPGLSDAVRDRAVAHSLDFVEYRGPLAAEMLAGRLGVQAVVASFSTALPTVHALLGTPIGASGTSSLLRRLTPFENSNRIPLTLVDALTRGDRRAAAVDRQLLVDAVGYAMQPEIAAHLRPRAELLLTGMDAAERDRYFASERLAALRLPGAPVPGPVRRLLEPTGGVGRIEEWRLTAVGARGRAARAWRALRGR
jgi:hypothetical protein